MSRVKTKAKKGSAKATKKTAKRGRKSAKRSKARPASPLSLASKMRAGIHDGLVDPAVTRLVNEAMHETALAFSKVHGEQPDQKLVRSTGKVMLNYGKGKRKAKR